MSRAIRKRPSRIWKRSTTATMWLRLIAISASSIKELGKLGKALDNFTLSLKHEPRHVEAHYNLGNLYYDAGELPLARLHYEAAAQIESGFSLVYFNLALAHFKLERSARRACRAGERTGSCASRTTKKTKRSISCSKRCRTPRHRDTDTAISRQSDSRSADSQTCRQLVR